MEPVIAESARKWGIGDEDILHAYYQAMYVAEVQDDGLTMVVGGDTATRLLEVGYVISDDGIPVIVHAMPARAKYLR